MKVTTSIEVQRETSAGFSFDETVEVVALVDTDTNVDLEDAVTIIEPDVRDFSAADVAKMLCAASDKAEELVAAQRRTEVRCRSYVAEVLNTARICAQTSAEFGDIA